MESAAGSGFTRRTRASANAGSNMTESSPGGHQRDVVFGSNQAKVNTDLCSSNHGNTQRGSLRHASGQHFLTTTCKPR